MTTSRFRDIFRNEKPVIGMIHLAGENNEERVQRALEEMTLYEEEGVAGAIIEDYHGTPRDIEEVLRQSQGKFEGLVKGVNVLRNPYSGFVLAKEYGAIFIQFDSVQTPDLNLEEYDKMRRNFPDVAVLGGIGFKYTAPTGNLLEVDLREGKSRCEAIVTTGSGTGIETPTDKLTVYKELLGDFPLIVGAGVDVENVEEQLKIADGAIIGTGFKQKRNTRLPVDRKRVREIINIIKQVRKKNKARC
jgi:hypothetical protein